MRVKIYSPCKVCENEVTNDIPFFKYHDDHVEQYSLCNKHLPRWSLYVFLRKRQLRIGSFLASILGFGCGYGRCSKCKTPWDLVKGHSTTYSETYACFPLCEKCWQELTPDTRMPYYMQLVDEWEKNSPDHNGTSWAVVRRQIQEGVMNES